MLLYSFTVYTRGLTPNKGDFLNDANSEQDFIKYLIKASFETKKDI